MYSSAKVLNINKRRLKLYFAVSAIIGVILVWVIVLQFHLRPIAPITIWQIEDESTLNAEILWQKSVPCLTTSWASPHGIIAVSDTQLLFHCSRFLFGGEFTAYDLLSGRELWQQRQDWSVFQVIAVEDGYLGVFDDTIVNKINFEGDVIWQSPQFLSRRAREMFVRNSRIFVPINDATIHLISSQTGEVIEETEVENIIAVFDDVFITSDNQSLSVIDRQYRVIWRAQVPFKLDHNNLDRIDDVLIVHFAKSVVRAYNISTGAVYWSMERDSGSVPLLSENRLYIYRLNNELEVYQPYNGSLIGKVVLNRNGQEASQVASDVAIAVNGHIVSLAYRNTRDIITLKIASIIDSLD